MCHVPNTVALVLILVFITVIRLPSSLRNETRECVHLVTSSHFRSHKKDGGHTIRLAIGENPMLYAHFTAVCVIDAELLAMEDLTGPSSFGVIEIQIWSMHYLCAHIWQKSLYRHRIIKKNCHRLDPYNWTSIAKNAFWHPFPAVHFSKVIGEK